MMSRNKPAPRLDEQAHLRRLAAMPCIVCGTEPVEIHEINQGQWFTALPLCTSCHRDSRQGWHGQRLAWKLKKWDELDALNETLRRLFA